MQKIIGLPLIAGNAFITLIEKDTRKLCQCRLYNYGNALHNKYLEIGIEPTIQLSSEHYLEINGSYSRYFEAREIDSPDRHIILNKWVNKDHLIERFRNPLDEIDLSIFEDPELEEVLQEETYCIKKRY